MTWHFSMAEAPRDGSRIIIADTHGGMFFTKWLEPNKHRPAGRFDAFPENAKTLLAWRHGPVHPHHMVPADLPSRFDAVEIPIIEDVGGGH